MACRLNREQVLDLYEVLYGEITDRIEDSTLPKIDINQLIKETYNVVKEKSGDQVKALLYAQAIPYVFYLVTQDDEVNDYLVDNEFDTTGLSKMRKRFGNILEVGKDVAQKKTSKSEIDSKIKETNKGKKNFVPKIDIDPEILWAYNEENGFKVSSSWTTTIQQALPKNPETVSDEERNILDPEKIMFGEVVKAISLISREKLSSEPLMYQGKLITLTAMLTRNIDKQLLTSGDKKYQDDNLNDNGISGVLTDEKGNFLYFTEAGNLTENPEEGRIVYQYFRVVSKVNGKLILGNPQNVQKRKYTLVQPEVLANRQKDRIIEAGGKVSDELFNQIVKDFADNQEREMNQLYQLRKLIEDGTVEKFTLPILGATLGIASEKTKLLTLEEAGVVETDIKNYTGYTTGKFQGYQYIIVNKIKAGGVSVDQQIFFQRSDISAELADKISTVLTTKALLKGRELTPNERKSFFEVYISNSTPEGKNINRDRIQVFVRTINNIQTFVVELNGEKIPDEVLYTEEGKKMILDHLLGLRESSRPKDVKAGEKEGSNGYWPANVHYNTSLQNKTFDDYVFENNIIKEKTTQHFDAIKSYIKLEYPADTLAQEKGINAYISYTIPEGSIENGELISLHRPKAQTQSPTKAKTDKEVTKPVTKSQSRTKPATTSTPQQETTYTISMKNQIKDAGGKVENYKSGMKVNELAEAVNLTTEQITQFRANALDASPDIKATVKPKPLTETEVKETNVEINPATRVSLFSDILEGSSNSALYKKAKKDGLNRDKLRDKFFDRVFTSKADRAAAEKWWASSPLSKFISLERITEVVNSDAFATWAGYGITLYEADGGTSVDLYHEAWHGFSQLFLSKQTKINMYEELLKLPKYANKTYATKEDAYFDIEEDLAEEFRDYSKSKGKKATKGFLSKIFDTIYKFIQKVFGRTTKKQVATNLQDIDTVKEMFDKLYRASENPEILSHLKPSMDNVILGKLNRAKTINDNFTLEESKKISDAMDSMMGIIFKNYNQDYNTTAAAIKLLKDPEYKKDLYRDIYDRFEKLRISYIEELEKNNDLILDPKFSEEYDLLDKIISNFGNLTSSLEGKAKNNVIAYHLEKSRFKILKDQYIEIEDPSNIEKSGIFIKNDLSTISAKELASMETMMLLAGLFKVTKEGGKVVENREGLFGLPALQDVDITWNRLAKILQGSFDEIDMYLRIFDNSENYPELQQLRTLLPNPFKIIMGPEYGSSLEFDSETNFWQDFKKPRIPYVQLNLNKSKLGKFEARLARANFDVYQVIQDWKYNFATADSTINKYIIKDKYDRNILNTAKIVKDFGIDGTFNYRKSNEFLQAIGIVLDQSSSAIQSIINNPNKPFGTAFGVDRMYDVIKKVNKSTSPDAFLFKKEPLTYLLEGLPDSLRDKESESDEVRGRLRVIAEVQNEFSDSYSNFSVQTPEGNRVWEHMVDNTITRIITSINFAKNWKELTTAEADPNGKFKHMRWLNEANNTLSPFSKLLRSIFDLDQMSPTYGEKINDTKILVQNVAGTQMVSNKNEGGTSTASMDATSKFLQEFHTMLLGGVEEFMRHASKNTAMGMSLDGDIITYNGKKAGKLYVDLESFLPYSDGEIKGYDIVEGYLAGEANRIVRFQQGIDKFKNYAGYNRKVKRKDNKKTAVIAGQAFTAFDDILTQDVQAEIYSILDKASENPLTVFDFMQEMDNNPQLRDRVRVDVANYFNLDTNENLTRLQKAKYVDNGLMDRIRTTNDQLTDKDIETALMKAYTYNSFIHKMETVILAYGDLVQYNHAKEEFHKRNAGLASGGKGFRSDKRAQIYLSSLKNYYAEKQGHTTRNYDGTLVTAIIKEMTFNSVMYKEYRDDIEESIYKRTKDRKKSKELADKAAAEYFSSNEPSMKIADGQGHITFEYYRILKKAEGNWSDPQELLYRKVAMGENITVEDVVEFFPPYKLQYFGNIESEGLPVNSFHKFSLAPLIPGVAKVGTPMYDLHEKMMKDQVDYVLFESASKVAHTGTSDNIFNDDGSVNKTSDFTKNIIYAEFLKNQTEINTSYKEKSIFSTQLRKMILEGLYEQGKIKSTKYEDITNDRVKKYIDHVDEYTNLLKIELLEEMGYEEVTPGVYKAKDKTSIGKLLNMIRQNLEREDLLSDDLIEFIDVYDESGELEHDLSFHPEAAKIEKLLLSMINKRIIKQKVAGEPLVQVSVGMYANQFSQPDLIKATKDEIKMWGSATYLLPTYHKKSDGFTAATKIMIAMQGSYYNLFNLKHTDNESVGVYNTDPIYDIAFSELKSTKGDTKLFILESDLTPEIKANLILDNKNGKRVKGSTYQGIEVLGDFYSHKTLKSSDRDALDIIVVKSKEDAQKQYDAYVKGGAKQFTGIGNVTFSMENLDMDASLDRLNEVLKNNTWLDADNGANRKAVTIVGVRIPVQGLNSMEYAEVFEFLPPQAGNIIISAAEIVAKSGGDFDIDKLSIFMNTLDEDGKVIKRKYKDNNSIKNLRGTDEFISAVKAQKAGLENELIQDIKDILELPENYTSLIMPNGTFILKEIADELASKVMKYNPKKNKMTEDTGEISPTRVLEALYNVYKHESNIVGKKTLGLGAIENTFNVIMNSIGAYMPAKYTTNKILRTSNMRLRNNKMKTKDGTEVISMSNLYDVDGVNKISDVISQMMNGWVDVEKDAWIFFIQGNYEVAPTLLYLVKAGVPVKEAILFVSNPLVREYVDEQRLAKSTFADVLNKKPEGPGLAKYKASSEIIKKYFTKDELSANSKNDERYEKGQELLDKYFANEKNKNFTEDKMQDLINDSQVDMDDIMDNYYDKSGILPTQDEFNMLVTEAENEITKKLQSSDQAKAMFLHYLELEQQIAGYTALKMSSNPDTATKSTLSDVEQTEANIENLFFDSRVPLEIVEAMMDDSILKSFFNGPLALAVSRPLFKLRYHKEVSEYLISKKDQIKEDLENTFPGKNIEMFSNVFRNDLVSFIFQNAIRKYKKEDGFMSLDLKTTIPTSMAKELNRGAFVKDGTLYMDMKQLLKEFEDGAWVKNADVDNNYEDRSLYPLHPSTFMNDSGTNFDQYLNFVSQREYLRSITPMSKEYVDSFYFQEELKNTKELFEELSNEKAVRYTYEKLIAIKALDASYNFFNMFQDSENAFAIRMSKLLQNYPQLKKDFPVLGKLKFDSDKNDSAYNLYIADKDYDNDKSNLYSNDLKKLADNTVQKVDDPIENARISSMFKYLNIYAFMQTGLNKTKLSFTNIVDFSDYLTIMESETDKFINALNKNGMVVLDNFYDQFIRQNSTDNNFKTRFKDYISDMDYENPERILPVENPTVKKVRATTQPSTSVESDSTNIDTVSEPRRLGLKTTDVEGMFTYNDAGAKNTYYYLNLGKNNPNVVFLHNVSLYEIMPNQKDKGINLGGASNFMTEVPDMSVNFPTDLFMSMKNGQKVEVSPSEYNTLKNIWEKRINLIKEIKEKGGKIAFPEYGFGNPKTMPQELFVYLSKRLFEEFQYLNPGSTMYNEIKEMVGITQGISDEEILIQLELEEDPFKCS
jgi:hypothetical protein